MAFLNKKGYNAKLIDKKYDFGVYTLVFEYGNPINALSNISDH